MALHTVTILPLVCFIFNLTTGEIFTSTARLAEMFKAKTFIVQTLDEYIQKEESRLNVLKSVKNDVSTLSSLESGSSFSLVEHPVGALHVVQTFHRLEKAINSGILDAQDITGALKSRGVDLPTVTDSQGAYNAILRLQRIYKLKAGDLVKGIVKSRQIVGLTAQAAVEIGNFAEKGEINKPLAVDWWEAALQKHVSRHQLTPLVYKDLLLKLSRQQIELGNLTKATGYLNHTMQIYGTDGETQQEVGRMKNTIEDLKNNGINLSTLSVPGLSLPEFTHNYSALCRGDPAAIVSDPSTSFCTLRPGYSPYDPVKIEVLNKDPFVAMFHDVISDNEVNVFKQTAFKSLERAKIGASNDSSTSEKRVGQLTWVDDNSPIIKKISTRVKAITGLDVTMRNLLSSSEPFQVVNYGIGGHYEPHKDYYENKEMLKTVPEFLQDSGERLATFLFYLNDVEEGGATVFPELGVRVPAIKSAAAFWFNLHRSGERDARTLHAGCPVLLGQKWVANKWIRERGQEFRHGCGLHPDDVHYRFDKERNLS